MALRTASRPDSNEPRLPLTADDLFRALLGSKRDSEVGHARALAFQSAIGWWAACCEGRAAEFPLAEPVETIPRLEAGVHAHALAYGKELSGLPVQDAVAALGGLYAHSLPAEHRAANGVFYTPPRLVRRLLDQATQAGMDWCTGRVLSPACGGGQFLVEAARRIVEAMDGADPAIVLAGIGGRLRGWDIDPFSAWLAQVAVEAVLLPQVLASGKRLATVTECRDSLLEPWNGQEGTWDLVVENPAFGKVKDTPAIRERFARSLHGHPNLYGLFMDAGVRLARPDSGIIAYLTPTSFLGGRYFSALRTVLATESPPVSIDLVESRKDVFEDVLQEVALGVFKRGGVGVKDARCSIVHVERDGLRIEDAGTLTLPVAATEPWILPRRPQDVPLVAAMQNMPLRLADYGYEVRTGPLVWNRHRARLHDRPAKGLVPVVWAESVTQASRFALKADKANHSAYYEPLSSRDPNLVRETCLLLQRTTAKEQHRRLIGAVMPKTIVGDDRPVAVENHLNMVVATCSKPAIPLRLLARFFASEAADRVIRCINASVAVSATELEAMPLPPVDDLKASLDDPDHEAALLRLYGIYDAPASTPTGKCDP